MSHTTDILTHLKNGGNITPLKALKLFDCRSLSQRISDIRRIIIGTKWRLKEDKVTLIKSGKRIKQFTMVRSK